MNTFTSVVEHQCRQMLHAAKMLDERGYIVHVWAVNPSDPEHPLPFGMTTRAVHDAARDWTKRYRRKTVRIDVWSKAQGRDYEDLQRTGKVFNYPFAFTCCVPRTRRLRIIVASLELMSATTKGRGGQVTGTGMLLRTELSDRFEFRGEDAGAFRAVLSILHMPDHREALLQ